MYNVTARELLEEAQRLSREWSDTRDPAWRDKRITNNIGLAIRLLELRAPNALDLIDNLDDDNDNHEEA